MLALLACQPSPPDQQTLAIKGATLIDGTSGPAILNSVMIIRGGRVVAAGSEDAIEIPKGADVNGRVTDVHKSGRLSEPGELDLVVTTLSSGRIATSVQTQPLVVKGQSHTKSNATKIGGGAALGAVIGAIAGGGKGAAIGTVVGGAC